MAQRDPGIEVDLFPDVSQGNYGGVYTGGITPAASGVEVDLFPDVSQGNYGGVYTGGITPAASGIEVDLFPDVSQGNYGGIYDGWVITEASPGIEVDLWNVSLAEPRTRARLSGKLLSVF